MSAPQQQLTPVSYKSVRFGDGFWSPRIETNRTVTLPHIYRKLEETGRIAALDLEFERPAPSPIVLIFGDLTLRSGWRPPAIPSPCIPILRLRASSMPWWIRSSPHSSPTAT